MSVTVHLYHNILFLCTKCEKSLDWYDRQKQNGKNGRVLKGERKEGKQRRREGRKKGGREG